MSRDNDRRHRVIEVSLTDLWLYLLKIKPFLFTFGDKLCPKCKRTVYYTTSDVSEEIGEGTIEYSETYFVCPHCKIAYIEANYY